MIRPLHAPFTHTDPLRTPFDHGKGSALIGLVANAGPQGPQRNGHRHWPAARKQRWKAMAVTAGIRLPVAHGDVFPHGCHLVPDSITEAQDWDEVSRTRSPTVDKVTGKRVYHVRVIDLDPVLEGRSPRSWSRWPPIGRLRRRPGHRSSRSSSRA